MARKSHRKNPIDAGIEKFGQRITTDASEFCGIPMKSFLLTKEDFGYAQGGSDNKSILIKSDENCEKVLNNLLAIASVINYVLSNPKSESKYTGMDSLSIEFSKTGGAGRSAVFTVLDESNINAISAKLTIYNLIDLRNKTQIKSLIQSALKVKRLGLKTVPSLVTKGIKQETINTFNDAVLRGLVTWGNQPEGVTADQILDQAEDSVEVAETQTETAMSTGDAEDINEAKSSIESAVDDLDLGSKATDDPAVQDAIQEETMTLQELFSTLESIAQKGESLIVTPTRQPKAEVTAKVWTFSQTDAGVTAVQGSAGAIKNVLNLLRSKLDYYASDEQLYGIDVTFKVTEKSSGSVSASRSGKSINIKVNGTPTISDLIVAVSDPLAKLYDEQDIDFDEDGFGLAQELEWA
jgi:hypothetical protein